MREEQDPSWWKPLLAALTLLPFVVVAILLVRQHSDAQDYGVVPASAPDATTGSLSSSASPSASSTASPSGSPSASPSATPTGGPTGSPVPGDVPMVKDRRRADFGRGDGLPDRSQLFEVGGSSSGLAVGGGGLTHGSPTADDAVGYLQTRLGSNARKVGMRVRFADGDSGAAAISAWQSSLGDRPPGGPLPSTGMRLSAEPGAWELIIWDGKRRVLGSGTYTERGGVDRFSITRSGDQLWVVDPARTVSRFQDPQVEALAGPWVSWELSEQEPTQTPASILEVWAG